MAAQGELEKETIVHREGYDRFITLLRVGTAICLVIAFIVILLIAE
jgi:hypothetical protein